MSTDPHSFAPGDPDILVPRRLLVELLDRMEMAIDHVEITSGLTDAWGRRITSDLNELLK